jgi:TolB protein
MDTTQDGKQVRSRPVLSALALALAALAALVQGAPAKAAFPGHDGAIAYAFNDPSGIHDLFSVPPGGRSATRLTSDRPHEASPAYSADGTKIAFISPRDGNPEIYVMNADGSGVTRVTDTPSRGETQVSFSPSGRQLVFTAIGPHFTPCCGLLQQHLYVINVDGTGERQLTSGNVNDSDPVYSPSGSQIAFSRFIPQSDGTTDIYVIDPNGGSATSITRRYDRRRRFNASAFWSPDYSPSGRKLVVASNALEGDLAGADIYTMNADGSHLVRLADTRPDEYEVTYSPTGGRIAYTSFGAHTPEGLYVAQANGRHARQIVATHDTQRTESPSWQPIP